MRYSGVGRPRITPGQPLGIHDFYRALVKDGHEPKFVQSASTYRATFPLVDNRSIDLIAKHYVPSSEFWGLPCWSMIEMNMRIGHDEHVIVNMYPLEEHGKLEFDIEYPNGSPATHIRDPHGLRQNEPVFENLRGKELQKWNWVWPHLRRYARKYRLPPTRRATTT